MAETAHSVKSKSNEPNAPPVEQKTIDGSQRDFIAGLKPFIIHIDSVPAHLMGELKTQLQAHIEPGKERQAQVLLDRIEKVLAPLIAGVHPGANLRLIVNNSLLPQTMPNLSEAPGAYGAYDTAQSKSRESYVGPTQSPLDPAAERIQSGITFMCQPTDRLGDPDLLALSLGALGSRLFSTGSKRDRDAAWAERAAHDEEHAALPHRQSPYIRPPLADNDDEHGIGTGFGTLAAVGVLTEGAGFIAKKREEDERTSRKDMEDKKFVADQLHQQKEFEARTQIDNTKFTETARQADADFYKKKNEDSRREEDQNQIRIKSEDATAVKDQLANARIKQVLLVEGLAAQVRTNMASIQKNPQGSALLAALRSAQAVLAGMPGVGGGGGGAIFIGTEEMTDSMEGRNRQSHNPASAFVAAVSTVAEPPAAVAAATLANRPEALGVTHLAPDAVTKAPSGAPGTIAHFATTAGIRIAEAARGLAGEMKAPMSESERAVKLAEQRHTVIEPQVRDTAQVAAGIAETGNRTTNEPAARMETQHETSVTSRAQSQTVPVGAPSSSGQKEALSPASQYETRIRDSARDELLRQSMETVGVGQTPPNRDSVATIQEPGSPRQTEAAVHVTAATTQPARQGVVAASTAAGEAVQHAHEISESVPEPVRQSAALAGQNTQTRDQAVPAPESSRPTDKEASVEAVKIQTGPVAAPSLTNRQEALSPASQYETRIRDSARDELLRQSMETGGIIQASPNRDSVTTVQEPGSPRQTEAAVHVTAATTQPARQGVVAASTPAGEAVQHAHEISETVPEPVRQSAALAGQNTQTRDQAVPAPASSHPTDKEASVTISRAGEVVEHTHLDAKSFSGIAERAAPLAVQNPQAREQETASFARNETAAVRNAAVLPSDTATASHAPQMPLEASAVAPKHIAQETPELKAEASPHPLQHQVVGHLMAESLFAATLPAAAPPQNAPLASGSPSAENQAGAAQNVAKPAEPLLRGAATASATVHTAVPKKAASESSPDIGRHERQNAENASQILPKSAAIAPEHITQEKKGLEEKAELGSHPLQHHISEHLAESLYATLPGPPAQPLQNEIPASGSPAAGQKDATPPAGNEKSSAESTALFVSKKQVPEKQAQRAKAAPVKRPAKETRAPRQIARGDNAKSTARDSQPLSRIGVATGPALPRRHNQAKTRAERKQARESITPLPKRRKDKPILPPERHLHEMEEFNPE